MPERDFLLPDLGEGLTEVEIVNWLVAVGDIVAVDQPLAEVETAKAVVEVPCPFAGRVTRLHGDLGQEVLVGAPLITIETDVSAGGGVNTGAGASPEQQVLGTHEAPARGEPGDVPAGEEIADLVPEPEPADDGGSGNVLVGYGTGGGGTSRRRRGGPAPATPAAASRPEPPPRNGRPLAKPPVRKLAKDLGIDLELVSGTGRDGAVTREDVHAHVTNGGTIQTSPLPAAVAATAAVPPTDDDGVLVTTPDHERLGSAGPNRIPVRGVRKAIAEKMTTSRREIPDATTWVDVDATRLWKLRDKLNSSQTRVRVSPLALVLRAVVAGLREFPELNASLDTDAQEIVQHRHVNLGFAAQTARGLVVPVIKDAHLRSTLGLAEELNRLAEAARDGKATPAEMTGGTFTVSNYGSFGVDGGSAVINHPEAAILGVGRITDRPWVHKGKVKARKVMQLSIAFDHRICDGGEAAGFLRFVGDCVQDPTTLLGNL